MLQKTLIILALAVFFSRCSLPQIKNEAPQINTLKVAQKFKINLPEEHKTGYMWQLSDNYNKTVLNHLNAVWHGNQKGIDFNFETLSIGQTTLTLIKRRYIDTIAKKTFIVNIQNE